MSNKEDKTIEEKVNAILEFLEIDMNEPYSPKWKENAVLKNAQSMSDVEGKVKQYLKWKIDLITQTLVHEMIFSVEHGLKRSIDIALEKVKETLENVEESHK